MFLNCLIIIQFKGVTVGFYPVPNHRPLVIMKTDNEYQISLKYSVEAKDSEFLIDFSAWLQYIKSGVILVNRPSNRRRALNYFRTSISSYTLLFETNCQRPNNHFLTRSGQNRPSKIADTSFLLFFHRKYKYSCL